MGQSFQILENIAPLVKASSTTITMASTYLGMPTRITVGGRQYKASGTITLNTATTGINGLDTGSLASNTLYYVYAVQSSGVLGLVASTAAPGTGPTGFTAWKEIGRFRTDFGAANINTVVNRLIGANSRARNDTDWISFTPTGFWTTNTTYSGRIRRVASSADIEYRIFLSGAPNATSLFINMPTGVTIDSSKLATTDSAILVLGTGTIHDTGTYIGYAFPTYHTATQLRIRGQSQNPAAGHEHNDITSTIPHAFASGDSVTLRLYNLPIAEFAGLFDD